MALTPAEKQQRYRERLKAGARPVRYRAAVETLAELREHYQAWLEDLPEGLQGTPVAERRTRPQDPPGYRSAVRLRPRLTREEHMRGDKAAKMEVCREILARKDRRDAARAAGNAAEARRLEEEIVEFEALLVEVMSDDPAVAAAAVQRLPSTARRKALEETITTMAALAQRRQAALLKRIRGTGNAGTEAELQRLTEEMAVYWARLEVLDPALFDQLRPGTVRSDRQPRCQAAAQGA